MWQIIVILQIVLGILLYVLSCRDYKERCVSLFSLFLPGSISVCLMLLRFCEAESTEQSWMIADLLCGCFVGLIFLLISYVSDEKIGYGDSLIILILGIAIGGWNLVCLLEASSVFMIIYICWMCGKKRLNRRTRVAFYPYLFLGYAAYLIEEFFR